MRTMMVQMVWISAICLVAGCGGEDSQAGGIGPLQDVVFLGTVDGWSGTMADGTYWLENQAEPSDIRYFYTPYTRGEGGKRSVQVDVNMDEAHPDARAGLLYGYRESPRFYYMIVASAGGEVEIYRRDGNSFELTMASSVAPAKAGLMRLQLEEDGQALSVTVNGKSVNTRQSAGIGAGALGIAAMGLGRFGFTNYRQSPTQMATTAAPAARPRQPGKKAHATPAGEVLRLRRFDIVDRQGFQNPLVIVSFLAPADWRLEGGVKWNFQWRCVADLVSLQARVISPDGRRAFEIFPQYATKWYDNPMSNQLVAQEGCATARPFTSAEFIAKTFVPGFRRGAAIVSNKSHPAVAQAAREKAMQLYGAQFQQLGWQLRTDASQTRIAYQGNAGSMEECVLATVSVTTIRGGFGSSNLYSTLAESVLSFQAPKGQLDENQRLFSTIVASLRVNPAYINAVQGIVNRIAQIQQQGFNARMKIIRQQNERSFKNWEASLQGRADDWKRQTDRQDRTYQRMNEALRGTATFRDPESSGTSWELSNGYEQVWKSSADEFILTNDPNFNPNVAQNSNEWNLMDRVK